MALSGDEGAYHRLEDLDAIRAPELRLGGALRVRHHAQDVPTRTADASDIFKRTVGIDVRRNLAGRRRVTEYDAILAFEFLERLRVTEIVPFHVTDRNGQHFAGRARVSKRSGRVLDTYLNGL